LYDASWCLGGYQGHGRCTGYYWFTDLLAGATYTIEFVKPAGYTYTPVVNADPTANKDGGLDSDAPVADGKVTFVAEVHRQQRCLARLRRTTRPSMRASLSWSRLVTTSGSTATGMACKALSRTSRSWLVSR
jgi:hypothetical protein